MVNYARLIYFNIMVLFMVHVFTLGQDGFVNGIN